jgi:ketosteroid isomerase-like protein
MKRTALLFAALISGSVFLFSCNSSTEIKTTATFDTAAAKKEIEAVNLHMSESIAKGDSVAAADCYLPDAKFMAANMPAIVGQKNIQSAFAGFIKSGITKLEINMTHAWGDSNLMAEEGTYALGIKDGHIIDKGKYIVIWKKDAQGKWKIARDINNSDMPLPPAPSSK